MKIHTARINKIIRISVSKYQRGQSLVQVIVAVAILSLLMMTIATTMTNMSRQNQGLTQKLAAMDFQQQLTRVFADGSLCLSILVNGPGGPVSFNVPADGAATTANPASKLLNITSINISTATGAPVLAQAGSPLSSLTTSLTAAPTKTFAIANIVGTSFGATGSYVADFQVNFDNSKLVTAIRPATTQVTLQTASSGGKQTITSCAVSGSTPACHPVTPNATTGWVFVTAHANCAPTETLQTGGSTESLPSGAPYGFGEVGSFPDMPNNRWTGYCVAYGASCRVKVWAICCPK